MFKNIFVTLLKIKSMELRIKELSELVDKIKKDPKNAEVFIRAYGDHREGVGISKGWDRCRRIYEKQNKKREDRLRKSIIHYDEENSCISTTEAIELLTSVEDEAKRLGKDAKEESANLLEMLCDFMYSKIKGDIKFDRRLLFSRNGNTKSNG